MKKILAIAMAAALSLTVLAGCGETNNNNNNNNNNKDNTAPTISGVLPEATVMAGEEFDALKGVTATDKEDGDLTSKITVSANGLTFTDGKTTPTEASEYTGYEIVYTVKDSGGLEATEYCTLYVKQAAAELENVFTADFTAPTAGEADSHYWDFNVDSAAAATKSFEKGAVAVDVTKNGGGEDKITLARRFDDLGAGTYTVAFWAYASAPIKATIRTLLRTSKGEVPEGGWDVENLQAAGQDGWGKDIGTAVTKISHTFELTDDHVKAGNTSVLFRLGLGGGYDNQPETYKVYLEKVAIWKETGVEKAETIFTNDFSKTDADQVFARNEGGAEATATVADGVAKFSITKFGTEVYHLKADVALGTIKLEKDVKYRVKFDITATKDQVSEVVIENGRDNTRAAFLAGSLTLKPNEKQTVEYTFTAEKAIEADVMLRLQIGKASASVTDNELTIDNVQLQKITGDKKNDRVSLDKFVLFGEDSSNKKVGKYPFAVYNGSDDNLANKGIGTAYFENGKLVYKIHEAGADGGNNKLAIGYWDNSIDLPANAYYVISFKIKASVALSFNLTLHDMNHAWGDPVNEGILLRRASWLNNAVQIGTTEQTLEFVTDAPSIEASKCELLLEFGSAELAKLTGDVTIEISELTIGVRKLAD